MRTLLLGDIGNRLDIADNETKLELIRRSQDKTTRSLHARDIKIDVLKQELEKQKLAVQALTRFLIQKDIIDQSELDTFIDIVDAEDGVIDGRMTIDSAKKKLVFKPIKEGSFKLDNKNG